MENAFNNKKASCYWRSTGKWVVSLSDGSLSTDLIDFDAMGHHQSEWYSIMRKTT